MTTRQLKDKAGNNIEPKMPVTELSITKPSVSGITYTDIWACRCGNIVQVDVYNLKTTSQQYLSVIAEELPRPRWRSYVPIVGFTDSFARIDDGGELNITAPANQSNGYIHVTYITNE